MKIGFCIKICMYQNIENIFDLRTVGLQLSQSLDFSTRKKFFYLFGKINYIFSLFFLENLNNLVIFPLFKLIPFPFPVTAVKLAKSRLLGSIPINCSRLKLPYPDTYTQITSAYLAPSRIREAVKKNKRALNAKGVERDEAREGKIKREREERKKKKAQV